MKKKYLLLATTAFVTFASVSCGVDIYNAALQTTQAEAEDNESQTEAEFTTRDDMQDIKAQKGGDTFSVGEIKGVYGENKYTEALFASGVYGEVDTLITYSDDLGGRAFILAGNRENGALNGSLWSVDLGGEILLLEQYITFSDETLSDGQDEVETTQTGMQYLTQNNRSYLFFNYIKNNRTEGKILCFDSGQPLQLLSDISGEKRVDEEGNIVCSLVAMDSSVNFYGKNYEWFGSTGKDYFFILNEDGTIREQNANVISEEELIKYSFGEAVLAALREKLSKDFDNSIRQYILRENGILNVNVMFDRDDSRAVFYTYLFLIDKENETTDFIKRENGVYLRHMTGAQSQYEFLAAFAVEGSTLENMQTPNLTWWNDDTVEREPYEPDEDLYADYNTLGNSVVYGREFEPGGMLAHRLSGLMPNYTTSDKIREWEWAVMDAENKAAQDEYYKQVCFVGGSESFAIFAVNFETNMIIKTPDNSYVWIDGWVTSYCEPPIFAERDFDGDGELEFVFAAAAGYGTGVYIRYLYIIDKDSDGIWRAFQPDWEWYGKEIDNSFGTKIENNTMYLIFNGERVGEEFDTEGDNSYYYSGSNQIRYDITEEKIILRSGLMAFSDTFMSGEGTKNNICLTLGYLGEGEWTVLNRSFELAE